MFSLTPLATLIALLATSTLAPTTNETSPSHISVFELFASYFSVQGFFHVAIPVNFKSFHVACEQFSASIAHFQDVQEQTLAKSTNKQFSFVAEKQQLQLLKSDLNAACADVRAWPGPDVEGDLPDVELMNHTATRPQKRAAHILAMKVLRFAGTSLGFFGMEYLWDKLFNNNDARIVDLENKIQQLSQNLIPLMASVNNLIKAYTTHIGYYHHGKQVDALDDAIRRFTEQIQTINLLWSTLLTSNRLSPNFMRPAVLQHFHTKIEDMLNERGHIFFLENAFQLLELPVSILHKNAQTFVVLHIPLVDKKMDLHRLVPLPLWVKDQEGEDNEVLDIITNTPFIAVSERGVFNSPLSRAQLDSCLPIGSNYFCAHPSYLKQFQSSCIGAMFAGGLTLALDHCATVRSKTTLVVQDTAAGYVIFSRDKITVFLTCKLKQVESLAFQGYKLFPFREDCSLHSSELFVPELMPSTMNFSKTAISATVPEFLGMNWGEYLEQRVALELDAVPLPRDPAEIQARFERHTGRSKLATVTLILATLSVLCTACIFTLLGIKFYLLRRATRLQLAAREESELAIELGSLYRLDDDPDDPAS